MGWRKKYDALQRRFEDRIQEFVDTEESLLGENARLRDENIQFRRRAHQAENRVRDLLTLEEEHHDHVARLNMILALASPETTITRAGEGRIEVDAPISVDEVFGIDPEEKAAKVVDEFLDDVAERIGSAIRRRHRDEYGSGPQTPTGEGPQTPTGENAADSRG